MTLPRTVRHACLSTLLAALAAAAPARAEEVAPGHITVMRAVPAHNAFRPGDIGQATTVATARGDLVAAGAGQLQVVIEPASDAILSNVGGQAQVRGEVARGVVDVTGRMLGGAGAPGAAAGQAAGRAGGAAAGIGGVVGRAVAPLGGALSALQGIK